MLSSVNKFIKSSKTKLYTRLGQKDWKDVLKVVEKNSISCNILLINGQKIVVLDKKGDFTFYEDMILNSFVKDFKLPIAVPKDPYFTYFVNLYDNLLQTKQKLSFLHDVIQHCDKNNTNFNSYSKDIVQRVTSSILDHKDYAKLKETISKVSVPPKLPNKANIYSPDVTPSKKWYISVDIRKADFSSIKRFQPSLVNNKGSYDEFILSFTPFEYYRKAKHFRSVVFGLIKLNLGKLQKVILNDAYTVLDKDKVLGLMGTDEIILTTTEEEFKQDLLSINSVVDNGTFRVEVFTLEPLDPFFGFERRLYNEHTDSFTTELKCVPKDYYAQVYTNYFSLPVHPYNLKTMKDGVVITFDETLF